MSILTRQIEHPGVAFCVVFVIGAVLAKYGVVNGTLLLIALFAGIGIYKMITA